MVFGQISRYYRKYRDILDTCEPEKNAGNGCADFGLDLRRRVAETSRIVKLAETPSFKLKPSESYHRRETLSPQMSAMPTVGVGLDLRRRVAETSRIVKLAEMLSCRGAEL
ncbi:hypothetical protein ACFX2A_014617 [Malus domestica]